jgi:hypothetical protein
MEKNALLERLVRLAATDVPNTPRLLMRQRSPQELAALQHGVETLGGLKPKVEGALHGAADKLFTSPVAGPMKKLISVGTKHPEIIPMQGVPVPGLTPAYLALKGGAEKLLDKVAPLPSSAAPAASHGVLKAAFAVSQYSGPLNPSIPSQASHLPGFLAPNLQSAVQKRKQAAGAPTRGNFMMASDIPSFNPPNLQSPIQKRSGFDGKDQPNEGLQKMSDGTNRLSGLDEPNQPVNKVGDFESKKKLEKDSDMLPDYVTYNQGDFKRSKYAMSTQGMASFVEKLRKIAAANSIMGVSPTLSGATSVAKSVGAPKLSGPGPSIAQQVKPKGPHFGSGIAGAFKGSIGGRTPQKLE